MAAHADRTTTRDEDPPEGSGGTEGVSQALTGRMPVS